MDLRTQRPNGLNWRPDWGINLSQHPNTPMSETRKTTIVFRKMRETKNTVRFEEETSSGKPPVIGTIYIQKWFTGNTEQLTVTIERKGE